MNPALLLGCIVTIPAHISAPATYCEQFRRDCEARIGRVVEVEGNLVVVRFFGYSHDWDYSLREAQEFEVNATIGFEHSNGYTPLTHLPHCKRHYATGAEVMYACAANL
jgi:hypothetical protein